MVAIRCTQKLLTRIGVASQVIKPTTTILGDWYAQPLAIGHQRLILLISEHSRLPVIMPGRDASHLARNFPEALALVLLGLALPPSAVENEVNETREAVIAATNNRSLLGTLNDFSFMLKWWLADEPGADQVEAALRLSATPVRPLGRAASPDRVTRELLS